MPRATKTTAVDLTTTAPAEVAPEPSAAQDEHRGLAARLLDLRQVVESHRQADIRERHQLNQKMAQLEQLVSALASRIDREVEAIQKQQRELETTLRSADEQVRVTGSLSRKMTDQMKELEELREMAADPHEVVKPLQTSIAHLRGDLEALGRTIDIRFESAPKTRAEPYEMRDASEDPFVKMGTEIRKLKEKVARLEG